jgi:hypothetical protein
MVFSAAGHSGLRVESSGATVLKGALEHDGATVLAGASCSEVYSELCVTLGHQVGPALARASRTLRIVSKPLCIYIYIYIASGYFYCHCVWRLFSSFTTEGGFFMSSVANSIAHSNTWVFPPSFVEGGFLRHRL